MINMPENLFDAPMEPGNTVHFAFPRDDFESLDEVDIDTVFRRDRLTTKNMQEMITVVRLTTLGQTLPFLFLISQLESYL